MQRLVTINFNAEAFELSGYVFVKEIMGHSQIETTTRYLHTLQEHLKGAVEKVAEFVKNEKKKE